MSAWWVVAAVAWAALAWVAAGVPEGEALRAEVRQRLAPPKPWRARLAEVWLAAPGRFIGAGTRRELEATGTPVAAYASRLGLFAGFGALAFGLDFRSPFMAVLGGAAGAGVARWMLRRRWAGWRTELIAASVDLTLFLKARLQSGETVEQAVRGVRRHLKGALRVEWDRMLAMREAGAPLREGLYALGDLVGDRDFVAVLHQLALYEAEAVPPDPFGTLAPHLARMQALRREYLVRRSSSSITVLAGVAMLTALVSAVGPALYLLWVQSLSNIPL